MDIKVERDLIWSVISELEDMYYMNIDRLTHNPYDSVAKAKVDHYVVLMDKLKECEGV